NLKKQGALALTFRDPAAWELVREGDRLSFTGVESLAPGSIVAATARHVDGTSDTFECVHSFNELQIAWFGAGSALNYLREQNRRAALAAT
ncbi:MAG TPA: aconitate hydratase, partial [Planctomycetota bacterium]|nr:aconitate hydratase [Planctomycetota bacterium]